MKTYIGIDLGGTNVRVAKVDEEGHVLDQVKGPSYGQEGPEKVLDNLKDMVRQIKGWEECEGIGVGVPGPVDTKNGTMVLSTNLPGFKGYPFARELTEEFHKPAYLDNDANVAGLAEALVGAGKGLDVVFYTTLSTGVGGALIVNGKTVSGKHGFGAEVANIVIDRNREKINYLNVGAIENEASGTAVTRKGRAVFGEDKIHNAGDVFNLAAAGDPKAQEIVRGMQEDLGQYFATVACVCDPEMFVLGGGMMKSKDKFLDGVIENYKKYSHEEIWDTPFVEAELDEPGVIGAAMLVRANAE